MKRLIVCLDGTWNRADQGSGKKDGNPTNVVKIMRAIAYEDDHNVKQITFYDAGVGTGGPVDSILGGAFGWGLSRNVQDGYRFLANNWEQGDEIYIFGFSRGAYTARSLAGLIGFIGLLEKSEMEELSVAWKVYRTHKQDRNKGEVARLKALGRPDIDITCVGVWDTVGARGIPLDVARPFNKKKFGFHDVELGKRVINAFHAVAIDEKRGPFAPALWTAPEPSTDRKTETVEQVWFPGVHSDIGGSYKEDGLADTTLDWMIQRVAAKTALKFETNALGKNFAPDPLAAGHESRTGLYAVSRLYPFQRLIGGNMVPGSILRRWRRIDRRNLPEKGKSFANEMLHISAIQRYGRHVQIAGREQVYDPANLQAAIGAQNLPVVDESGAVIRPREADWPEVEH